MTMHVSAPSDNDSEPAEKRREPRSALAMMRAAKLICQTGEYLCLIRDVSAGGVKLRLFHEMPDETHVFMERADGELHALIRVWVRDNTAGFRFVQPVDPEDFMNRAAGTAARSVRLRMPAPAVVHAHGRAMRGRLRDLAQGGAQIEIDACLPIGETVVLSVDRLGEQQGWIRWRRGQAHGIVFDVPRRLDQLAADALALQPLAAKADRSRGVA